MLRIVLFGAVCLLSMAPSSVLSMTDEQKAMIHEHFQKVGMECITDNPITEEDINNLKNKKIPTGENAPCFMSCMLKKVGIMNEQGMLQKDTAIELARKVFKDEEEVKNIADYLHSCSHINDASVSDGEKGCDRAMLALKCMIENSSKFGFDM